MKREVTKILIIIAFAFACIWSVAAWIRTFRNKVDVQQQTELILPSPADIQTWLNILEPENAIEVDGRVGAKTIEKWERCYCNQQGEKVCTTQN